MRIPLWGWRDDFRHIEVIAARIECGGKGLPLMTLVWAVASHVVVLLMVILAGAVRAVYTAHVDVWLAICRVRYQLGGKAGYMGLLLKKAESWWGGGIGDTISAIRWSGQ